LLRKERINPKIPPREIVEKEGEEEEISEPEGAEKTQAKHEI